jgi:hypothetical protein
VTPGPRAPACARCHAAAQLLASFCAQCGHDLRQSEGLPASTGLNESWSQPEQTPIECLLGNHALLAAVRQNGCVDLWNPYQGKHLQRLSLQLGNEILAAALLDNLLVALSSQEVEVLHLTPALRQDLCRFDRNARKRAPGPLCSRLAVSRRRLAWQAGDHLVSYLVRPDGLKEAWKLKTRGTCLDLAFGPQGLWCLRDSSLSLFDQDGRSLTQVSLPAPAIGLQVQDQDLWVCGRQGELWRCQGERIQRAWPAQKESCFAFGAGPRHVLQCSGRNLHLLSLESGRQHWLQVPQPCVLPPLLGPSWAVLVSYEGMVYHLALDQEQPRVLQARRPFSSFEPIMLAPVVAGDKLVLCGPEGQLAAWSL